MLESCFQRLFGVISHVEFTFPQNGGGTVCNLRFFFHPCSVAGVLARLFNCKTRKFGNGLDSDLRFHLGTRFSVCHIVSVFGTLVVYVVF